MKHAASGISFLRLRAVVAGGTSGIGRGAAIRLAEAGFSVAVLGRSIAHGNEVVEAMIKVGAPGAKHSYIPLNAFSLASVRQAAHEITRTLDGAPLDVLFMSHGMATLQGRTETSDGFDEKLSLHVYSRLLLTLQLLPSLRIATAPRVISVLSGGVHGLFQHWRTDPELRTHYSIKNAADLAGLLNDACFDGLSREPENKNILFVHAAPGFVASNWGTEFPMWLRLPLRALQKFAPLRTAADAAEALLDTLWDRENDAHGFRIIDPDGQIAVQQISTSVHNEATEFLWPLTKALVLEKGM